MSACVVARRGVWLSACLCLACLAGCGKKEEKRVLVIGKVTVEGNPLTTGTVIFRPDADKGNASKYEPRCELDEDGKYSLFMTQDVEGVTPGWYRVAVAAQKPIDPKDPYAAPVWLIPREYSDPATAGISIEVVENPAPDAYDIKVVKTWPKKK